MPLKKYQAEKDATITNAYNLDNKTLAFNSNTGGADSLEIFSILGNVGSASLEKSRALVQFNIENIKNDIDAGNIPSAGAKYIFKLYNVEHTEPTPRNFTVLVAPLSQSWEEGYGMDLDGHTDLGVTDLNIGTGVTWRSASKQEQWAVHGGTTLQDPNYQLTQVFETGLEDLSVDVTGLVNAWIDGTIPNYGFLVKLSGSFEDGSDARSYYTKKFSARGTQYFFGRPSIDVIWEEQVQDNRKNFFAESPNVGSEENKMNLYFYNRINGRLKNLPNNTLPTVKLYSDAGLTMQVSSSFNSVSNPLPGVYKFQTIVSTELDKLYDVWTSGSTGPRYFSSAVDVYHRENNLEESQYIVKITNLKTDYSSEEKVKFNIAARLKDWKPNILSIYSNTTETEVLNDLYYRIIRVVDNYIAVDYSLEAPYHTKCGSDDKGNYFTIDMSILEPGYVYSIKLARIIDGFIEEYKEQFKFRIY